MEEKDSKEESKPPKDPKLLEKLYKYHSLDGKVPTEAEFEERIRRGIEEIEARRRARGEIP